jgi:hypothetical protein
MSQSVTETKWMIGLNENKKLAEILPLSQNGKFILSGKTHIKYYYV